MIASEVAEKDKANKGKEFFLPKGTIVKHGTSLCRVDDIIVYGIRPGAERSEKRAQDELLPEINGVYVGNLLAYFGAYAAYSSLMTEVWNLPIYLEVISVLHFEPRRISHMALPDIPLTLPVVLSIQLGEDCLLYADEDFVLDGTVPVDQSIPEELLVSEAEAVWDKWQTGCLMRNEGIPSNWIKEIEYPRLGSLQGTAQLHKDTYADCELFAGGTMQAALKREPASLIQSFYKAHKRTSLSQKVPATNDGLNSLKNQRGISGASNQFFNHAHLQMAFEHMAEMYGIPLHR